MACGKWSFKNTSNTIKEHNGHWCDDCIGNWNGKIGVESDVADKFCCLHDRCSASYTDKTGTTEKKEGNCYFLPRRKQY